MRATVKVRIIFTLKDGIEQTKDIEVVYLNGMDNSIHEFNAEHKLMQSYASFEQGITILKSYVLP
jgi:hypothetical protein